MRYDVRCAEGSKALRGLMLAPVLVASAVVTLPASLSTAPTAFASGDAESVGLPAAVAFGLSGYLALQRLDLGALNAQLADVPQLPAHGWAAGYGVMVVPPAGWGFASSSGSFRWEARDGRGVSRLRVAHVQLGPVRRILQSNGTALTVGILGGLATAELEVAGRAPEGPDDFTMNRFTRRLLTLEPQVGLSWKLSRGAFLHLSAGYLVGTDFWNSRWAHPYGTTLPGVPALLHGPGVRMALVVGGS